MALWLEDIWAIIMASVVQLMDNGHDQFQTDDSNIANSRSSSSSNPSVVYFSVSS